MHLLPPLYEVWASPKVGGGGVVVHSHVFPRYAPLKNDLPFLLKRTPLLEVKASLLPNFACALGVPGSI